jgi:predicted  nucleic acid-binding Zn-ribbon protein
VPFLTAREVVGAVTKSTQRYLEFLTRSDRGVEKHAAVNIHSNDGASLLLENSIWSTYSCELPLGLRISSDSSATLEHGAAHVEDVEIRILQYDRRDGQTKFAVRNPVSGETGFIVIDFRWLVRRCLEWYKLRGSSVCSITGVETPAQEIPAPSVSDAGLSSEQAEAIATMLTTSLAYIWGPPGTGKTKWVLAKAVQQCVGEHEKALVLAPTNIAVDNALSAILEEGVPHKEVVRIGVPSREFLDKYPECCEERAFQQEIVQIGSQIKALEESIGSLQRHQELEVQAKDCEIEAASKQRQVTESQASLTVTLERIRESKSAITVCRSEVEPHERELESKRSQLDRLGLPKLLSDIETLQCEQTETIGKVAELKEELRDMGFFVRIFTKRKKRLSISASDLSVHLRATEATLESMRTKRAELAPSASLLQGEINALEETCQLAHTSIADLQRRISGLEAERGLLETKIAENDEALRSLESRIKAAHEELSHIDGVPSTEHADEFLATWQAEKGQLEARLSQFKQDLASKSVLGMTLDGFIGLSLQMALSVHRVFIDEAPYAPIAKVLPLLSLHRPIAMLGDHLQLPPVCECTNDEMVRAYWAKPSIFLENAFELGENWHDLNRLEEPQFQLTQRRVLSASYRFGQSLASLLDRHIYGGIGLTGVADGDTYVQWIHCEPRERRGRRKRENHAEADAILDQVQEWWESTRLGSNQPTLAILTPYKYQATLIRKRLKERFRDTAILLQVDVLNTHQAQGREWDWVFFSVADTGNLKMNGPYFTDSTRSDGKALLNTTIGRTKRKLVVFLDATFWADRPMKQLLTDIVNTASPTKGDPLPP